jgi:hypothetical protein
VGTLHSKYTYTEMSSAINDEMTMNRNANTVEGASLKSLVALKVAALVAVAVCPVVLRPGRWAQAKRRPSVAEDLSRCVIAASLPAAAESGRNSTRRCISWGPAQTGLCAHLSPNGGDMQDLSKQAEQESNPKDETEVQVLTERNSACWRC